MKQLKEPTAGLYQDARESYSEAMVHAVEPKVSAANRYKEYLTVLEKHNWDEALMAMLSGSLDEGTEANAEARTLFGRYDYIGAAKVLEAIPESARDHDLYSSIIERRDKANRLEETIRRLKGQVRPAVLRPLLTSLIDLHPHRTALQDSLKKIEELRPGEILPNALGMKFAWCPPTKEPFLMGSPESEQAHQPNETQHRVTLSSGFWMATTPITRGLFACFAKEIGHKDEKWRSPGFEQTDDHPVVNVNWDDCRALCDWLTKKDGIGRYRLPTEAEWEYACRASTTTPFYFGDTISPNQANYDGNQVYGKGSKGVYRQKTTPVGNFPPNKFGLFDMHGSVWEWCQDWYDEYPKGDIKDPQGAQNGGARVLRGGSWFDVPHLCRSAFRIRDGPGYRHDYFGCRVVFCLD